MSLKSVTSYPVVPFLVIIITDHCCHDGYSYHCHFQASALHPSITPSSSKFLLICICILPPFFIFYITPPASLVFIPSWLHVAHLSVYHLLSSCYCSHLSVVNVRSVLSHTIMLIILTCFCFVISLSTPAQTMHFATVGKT